jgi:hypothetical protein
MAREVCGLPEGSGGLLTSGGSTARFSAAVAAHHSRLAEDLAGGTVWVAAGSVPESGRLGPELIHGVRGLRA